MFFANSKHSKPGCTTYYNNYKYIYTPNKSINMYKAKLTVVKGEINKLIIIGEFSISVLIIELE